MSSHLWSSCLVSLNSANHKFPLLFLIHFEENWEKGSWMPCERFLPVHNYHQPSCTLAIFMSVKTYTSADKNGTGDGTKLRIFNSQNISAAHIMIYTDLSGSNCLHHVSHSITLQSYSNGLKITCHRVLYKAYFTGLSTFVKHKREKKKQRETHI